MVVLHNFAFRFFEAPRNGGKSYLRIPVHKYVRNLSLGRKDTGYLHRSSLVHGGIGSWSTH